jgi:hypothetical protein
MRIEWRILLTMVTPLCFAAGCAVGPQLKPEAVATVHDTSVRAFMSQNQLYGQYVHSGYGASGGLIGAVVDISVDAGRRRETEDRVRKLRDEITDYDFRTKYWEVISNQIAASSWLGMKSFQGLTSGNPEVTKDMVAQGAVFDVGSGYYLSQDCRVLIVETGIGVHLPGKTGKPAAGVIVYYYSPEIGEPEGEEAIPLWTTNGAAAYRSVAEEGIQQSGKLVHYAVEFMGRQPCGDERAATLKFRPTHARGDFGLKTGRAKISGVVLDETGDRVIFRSKSGDVYSLPAHEIELKFQPAKEPAKRS